MRKWNLPMTGRLIWMSMSSRMAEECVAGSDKLAGWTGERWEATIVAGTDGMSSEHSEEERALYNWDAAASETGRVPKWKHRNHSWIADRSFRTSSVCNCADITPVPRLGFVFPSVTAA